MCTCAGICTYQTYTRDRDRHLAEIDSFFPAKLEISLNRSYLKEYTIIMWTSLSLVMMVHMSPHLLVAALVSAHQTVSKTLKMRIFCQPSGKLLLNLAAETVLGYSCGHCGPGSGPLSARRSVTPCFPLQSL